MRALALHARRLAGTPELDALLGELSQRGPYERHLALHMAMAARHLAFVADALAGPDLDLRRAALRAVRTLPVPDDDVVPVLDGAPTALRRAVYRTLIYARRQSLADRILPEIRAQYGDREAAALLPACSSETVARLLPDLAHAVTMWRALAGRHPDAFLDLAEREILADGANRWIWLRRRQTGITVAAAERPHRTLDVLVSTGLLGLSRQLPRPVVAALYRAAPERFAELLRAERRAIAPHLLDTRHAPDDVVAARLLRRPYSGGPLLADLPPGRRDAVFRLTVEKSGGSLPAGAVMPLLPWLSPDLAAREARRLLDWYESVWHSSRTRLDDPDIPLRLTSYLPYEEAAATLVEASLGGDPRRRGEADAAAGERGPDRRSGAGRRTARGDRPARPERAGPAARRAVRRGHRTQPSRALTRMRGPAARADQGRHRVPRSLVQHGPSCSTPGRPRSAAPHRARADGLGDRRAGRPPRPFRPGDTARGRSRAAGPPVPALEQTRIASGRPPARPRHPEGRRGGAARRVRAAPPGGPRPRRSRSGRRGCVVFRTPTHRT